MASGGKYVSDGIPTAVSSDQKITGPNSKRPVASKTFESTTVHQCHHHGPKTEAVPPGRSQPPAENPVQEVRSKPRRVGERIEDVFQDEIVLRFPKMSEFKKFARSTSGLRLSDYDVENVMEDYRQGEEQKLQMLSLWRQKKGKNATCALIRKLVDDFFDRPTYFDQD